MQAYYFRPWTTQLFLRAGIGEGMSVLDIGSGPGDVSFIAAEIVGPQGSVVGVERDPAAVEAARRRAEHTDIVTFANAELDEFDSDRRFDALVGRFVLTHLPDPATTLHRPTRLVRPGGIVVMHEMDMGNLDVSFPRCQIWNDCYALLVRLFQVHGLAPDFGRRLTNVFLDAGLPWPDVESGAMTGGKPGPTLHAWLGSAVQAVEPLLVRAGIELPENLTVDDSLTETLERAVSASRSLVMGNTHFGAWTRVDESHRSE
ncbi:methyltransferase domain-containing protein [Lentzea jiangxiensis]|uniref:Methyltransferase domain-containing protein n=1 Tax=Lentzea jiangxiensis TaxID=641025 RepID=A0A1H0X4L6_9PSEU|nr:methyltransferase domain-containing protein [Lentzea jiangxiensis]SDP97426.1 Methyltransferase domain-containing protein [Lentzea jiangxiensis]